MTTLFKISRIQITLVTIGVLLFGFSCTGVFSHSSTHSSVNSVGVATVMLTDNQECCSTSISKNIDTWKNIILTVPDKVLDTLALLVLELALIFGYSWVSLWDHRPSIELDIGRLRLYIRQNPELFLLNYLKLAFARGILNSKIY